MESIFNWLSSKLQYILSIILSVLPNSPFVMIQADAEIQQVLRWVNWVIPVTEMVAILEMWLAAIAVFYAWQLILRFAKAIE